MTNSDYYVYIRQFMKEVKPTCIWDTCVHAHPYDPTVNISLMCLAVFACGSITLLINHYSSASLSLEYANSSMHTATHTTHEIFTVGGEKKTIQFIRDLQLRRLSIEMETWKKLPEITLLCNIRMSLTPYHPIAHSQKRMRTIPMASFLII